MSVGFVLIYRPHPVHYTAMVVFFMPIAAPAENHGFSSSFAFAFALALALRYIFPFLSKRRTDFKVAFRKLQIVRLLGFVPVIF
jgi:hypothetical protein